MSASVPESLLTTDQLLRLGQFGRAFADALDSALVLDSGAGFGQLFSYTVTGVEADRSELTITLPIAEVTANYGVYVTQSTATYCLGACVPASGKTVNNFVLSLTGLATAGDVFQFQVAQL